MDWIVAVVGAIAIPTLYGWWVSQHGGMRALRRSARPWASHYDESGRFVDPLKERREQRRTPAFERMN